MSSSALMSLTAADSSILTDSRSFALYGLLSDNTPVLVPGNELKKRLSGINPEFMAFRVTSIPTPTNFANDWYYTQAESVAYDPNGWIDTVNSAAVFRCPDDRLAVIQLSCAINWIGGLGAGEDGVARAAYIRYTSVTSNKYGTAYPVTANSVFSNVYFFGQNYRIQNGEACTMTFETAPIYVESGDQLMLGITASCVTNTPATLGVVWSCNGIKYNPTRTL